MVPSTQTIQHSLKQLQHYYCFPTKQGRRRPINQAFHSQGSNKMKRKGEKEVEGILYESSQEN